jgi:hypothetical protein
MKSDSRPRKQSKKPYIPPRLVIHGNVDTMTQSVGNVGDDGQAGTFFAG